MFEKTTTKDQVPHTLGSHFVGVTDSSGFSMYLPVEPIIKQPWLESMADNGWRIFGEIWS